MSSATDDVHELLGWEGPAFSVPIERGRIRDFADATFLEDPVYRDLEAARSRGFADLPAPPTFFGSLFYYDRGTHQPELPFDSRRTLHGEQSFEYHRTPVANETLYGRSRVADTFETERSDGGTLTGLEIETTFRDADGDLVLRSTKTVVEVN